MIEVRQTADFTRWLGGLRDTAARMRIVARIRRVEIGNIGDTEYFDGIGELASTTARATGSIS